MGFRSYISCAEELADQIDWLMPEASPKAISRRTSLDDALKALAETSYAQWFGKAAETGFDRAIDDEMLATCRELAQFVPDTGLITLPRGFGMDHTSYPSPPVPPAAADTVFPTASIPE